MLNNTSVNAELNESSPNTPPHEDIINPRISFGVSLLRKNTQFLKNDLYALFSSSFFNIFFNSSESQFSSL